MKKSTRARLLEIDDRVRLLNLLRDSVPEEQHVPNDSVRTVFEECVKGCPACEEMSGYTAELFELGREQRQLFVEIARSRVRIDPRPANEARQAVPARRQVWLKKEIERQELSAEDIEDSRTERKKLRESWRAQFGNLGDGTFRNDLNALGYSTR